MSVRVFVCERVRERERERERERGGGEWECKGAPDCLFFFWQLYLFSLLCSSSRVSACLTGGGKLSVREVHLLIIQFLRGIRITGPRIRQWWNRRTRPILSKERRLPFCWLLSNSSPPSIFWNVFLFLFFIFLIFYSFTLWTSSPSCQFVCLPFSSTISFYFIIIIFFSLFFSCFSLSSSFLYTFQLHFLQWAFLFIGQFVLLFLHEICRFQNHILTFDFSNNTQHLCDIITVSFFKNFFPFTLPAVW